MTNEILTIEGYMRTFQDNLKRVSDAQKAWQATENELKRSYGVSRYSSYESFKSARSRRTRRR